ncbi:MAG: FecR domain-containing protein [Tannerella sp.]|jgi:ferric-dicitrate binding protein FerR (iron transport regulator)|nr:FecR domain-containing protein [Tannerella sp.]
MSTEQLEKYLAGDASQQEKESVQRWLETDEKNRKEFSTLRMLYDVTLAHLPDEAAPVRRQPFAGWLKIAAAILITFMCSYYFLRPAPAEDNAIMQTLHVPAGQRAELTLTDGTKVWLNSGTTFSFPDRFSETAREVTMDGEAYFEVTEDSAKPFSVHTRSYDIRVLGTVFNVMAYSNEQRQFETSLIRGEVEIIPSGDGRPIKLMPGKRIYESNGRTTVDVIPDYSHFLWRKGIISFENERIENILKQFQLYYDIEIRNENTAINDMRYTGKFRIRDGIEHVLNVLKIPTGLRYYKDDETNFILIK